MNRTILVLGLAAAVPLLALLGLSLVKPRTDPVSALIGVEAPSFDLIDSRDGVRRSLASFRGRPVVLNFWATWCEPCEREHPVLQRAAEILGERVQFIGIAFDDDRDRIAKYLAEHGSTYANLVDDGARTAIAYGVAGVPETFFIDATGRIVSKYAGPLDAATLITRTAALFEEGR